MLIISKSMRMSIIPTRLGGKDEPLFSLFGIIFCIPLLSPLLFLMLLTFLNDLLISLFLFITKPLHYDKLQNLVFFKEYNLLVFN